ncbi:cytochrome c3 family protein [Adlercreutzia mucosicola]|uniref:cytochrome c3 family protein n=1 Tax=Adlercreutzia mucosicola TaxID=580026 RepID=UPI0004012F85|nr:cytochrome c3 family protein [Adlercreutzia mucosicola]MCR2034897.1 cytochrome c3 family protein [Adlercreutzia mucosicola]
MRKSNMSTKALIALSTMALVAALAAVGCAPAADSSKTNIADTGATEQAADPTDPTGPYVSNEACLACHGGSYEAHAAQTADLGQWNPHASIHGGYNSCDNCHEKGQEVTRNWCANCHAYSAEGSDYHEDSLFL